LKVNQRFGGAYGLRLQVRRINQTRNQREAGSKQKLCSLLQAGFLLDFYSYILKTEEKYSSETSVDFQRTTRNVVVVFRIVNVRVSQTTDNLGSSRETINFLAKIVFREVVQL
jgi:hypothetical protein